jgi:hypothetical protein
MVAEKIQTYADAVNMVSKVIADGQRIDRYLRVSDEGNYYTSPDREFLTSQGREVPVYVEIPVGGYDTSEEEEKEWAEALISELVEAMEDEVKDHLPDDYKKERGIVS